jgi:single-stranded DNA-binding protein
MNNTTTFTGYLRYEPDMKFTQWGKALTSFTLYDTLEKEYNRKLRIVAWDELGEACYRELGLMEKIHVKGYLKTRKWTDKTGNEQTITELTAQRVYELDGTLTEMNHPREIKYEINTKQAPVKESTIVNINKIFGSIKHENT